MMHVFILQLIFDEGNSYLIGAFDGFWKALAEAKKNALHNNLPEYGFEKHRVSVPRSEVWCRVTHNGVPRGIYYTIKMMKVK
jgi:hypothetical protein